MSVRTRSSALDYALFIGAIGLVAFVTMFGQPVPREHEEIGRMASAPATFDNKTARTR